MSEILLGFVTLFIIFYFGDYVLGIRETQIYEKEKKKEK